MIENEEQALLYAKDPNKVISQDDCVEILGYLNGAITDLDLKHFDLMVAADNYENMLIHQDIGIARAKSDYKVSAPYRELKQNELELRTLRSQRKILELKRKKWELADEQNRRYGNRSYLG